LVAVIESCPASCVGNCPALRWHQPIRANISRLERQFFGIGSPSSAARDCAY